MDAPSPETLAAMNAELDRHLVYVGRIASAYASIDHTIDQLIWQLSETDQALGACITSQIISTSSKLKVVLALLHLREGSEDFVKRINAFQNSHYPVTELRNRIVHDTWVTAEDEEVAQLRVCLSKNELHLQSTSSSIQDLQVTLGKIGKQQGVMFRLHEEILSWLPTAPVLWPKSVSKLSFGRRVAVERPE